MMSEEFAKIVAESASFFDKSQNINAEEWIQGLLERSHFPSTSQTPAFGKLLLEAARRQITVDDFSRTVNAVDPRMGKVLDPVYEKYRGELMSHLETIGYRHPNVVEVNWSIAGVMESNEERKIKEPAVDLTIKATPAGASIPQEITVTFTKDELQQLQSEIKEAQNMISKLSERK